MDDWIKNKGYTSTITKDSMKKENDSLKYRLKETTGALKQLSEQCEKEDKILAEDMISIIDNLRRCLEVSPSDKIYSVINGINMIHFDMLKMLEKRDVFQIKSLGEVFDPKKHHAIALEVSDLPKNTIIQVIEDGYHTSEGLLKAAKVVLSKGK